MLVHFGLLFAPEY